MTLPIQDGTTNHDLIFYNHYTPSGLKFQHLIRLIY